MRAFDSRRFLSHSGVRGVNGAADQLVCLQPGFGERCIYPCIALAADAQSFGEKEGTSRIPVLAEGNCFGRVGGREGFKECRREGEGECGWKPVSAVLKPGC